MFVAGPGVPPVQLVESDQLKFRPFVASWPLQIAVWAQAVELARNAIALTIAESLKICPITPAFLTVVALSASSGCSKAVSRPPHSTTLWRFGRFIGHLNAYF